jgi:hypothetical protein
MEGRLVDFARRVKNSTGSYPLPDTRDIVERIIRTLDPANADDSAFLSVWQWIGVAIGVGEVQLHDMLAFPVQYAMPRNKALFERMGFPMDRTFDEKTSRHVANVLFDKLTNAEIAYTWLVANAQLRLKHKLKTNVASKSWGREDVILLSGHIGPGVGSRRMLDAIKEKAQGLRGGNAFEYWISALMRVMDPMTVLEAVSSQFNNHDELEQTRVRLVTRQWPLVDDNEDDDSNRNKKTAPDYVSFLNDMMAYEIRLRNRNDPDMTTLFYEVQDDIPGPTADVVKALLAHNWSHWRPDLPDYFVENGLTFAGIQAGSTPWILTTVSRYVDIEDADGESLDDGVVANIFLIHALQTWSRHHQADPSFLPAWGQELLYNALVEENDDDEQLDIIISNIPNGTVPIAWAYGALNIAASTHNPDTFRMLINRLVTYGIIDPKTYKHGPNELTLIELAAKTVEDIDELEERFKHALRKGAPYPSRDAVLSWPPMAQTQFKLVTDAVNSMFHSRY